MILSIESSWFINLSWEKNTSFLHSKEQTPVDGIESKKKKKKIKEGEKSIDS